MGISKLIDLAITIAIFGTISGNLPWIIKKVRIAQLHLIQDSKASNWGTPWLRSQGQTREDNLL